MANIVLSLKSVFSGDGFNNANRAVQNLAGSAKRSIEPVKSIATNLGALDQTANKYVQAGAGVVTSFQTLGVVGGTASIALAGLNLVLQNMKEKADALLEKTKELGKYIAEKFHKTLGTTTEHLKKIGAEADTDSKNLDRIAASAKAVNQALGRTTDATAARDAMKIEMEKFAALMTVENESAKARVEADFKLKAAIEERTTEMKKRQREEQTVATDVKNAEKKQQRSAELLAAARDALKRAQEEAEAVETNNKNDTAALTAVRNNLKAAQMLVNQRETELTDATNNLTIQRQNLKTEQIKTETAEMKYNLKVDEATKTLEDKKRAEYSAYLSELKANDLREDITKAEAAREQTAKEQAGYLSTAMTERENALQRLREAEEAQAMWNKDKQTVDKNMFNKTQANMNEQIIAETEKRQNTKLYSKRQLEVAEQYKRWKELMKDKNPYDEMVMKFRQKVNVETEELQRVQEHTNELTSQQTEEINKLKSDLATLTSALKTAVTL